VVFCFETKVGRLSLRESCVRRERSFAERKATIKNHSLYESIVLKMEM